MFRNNCLDIRAVDTLRRQGEKRGTGATFFTGAFLKGALLMRNEKNPFPKFGKGREWKKSIPKIREREGNEKNPFPKFGNGKGMKKIHSRNSGRESEASILGNDREREFPLTPVLLERI